MIYRIKEFVMNKILKVFSKNKEILKNIIIVLIVAVCGVIYCIYGRGLTGCKDTEEYGSVAGWSVDEDESAKGVKDIYESESFCNQTQGNYVYICGYVINPGVYICDEGMRIYELIDMAGGFHSEADRDYLNLVEVVTDGQKIYVPKLGEVVSGDKQKVNINTADKLTLMTLPGIGESRASDIISYREEQGGFARIEDIMKVSGIKEAAYEKIKDYIVV